MIARAFLVVLVLLLDGAVTMLPAVSNEIADFYKGKTINIYVGLAVGGEYDLQARLIAKYIGRHIPGRPNVLAQNMPGAGGQRMLNFLYNQAPRDGTVLGMVPNGFPAAQAVGRPGIQADGNQLRWLGSIAPSAETLGVWHTAGVQSINDARNKEIVVGAGTRGITTFTYPALMNELLGTRLKIVTGYSGGNAINIAMERGEVQARNSSWSSWKATKGAWLREKKIFIVVQAGAKASDLDAPAFEDLVKNQADRQLLDLVMSGAALGRPMTTTPGVPESRLRALRAAFMTMMSDPDFIKEAARLNVDVEPIDGETMQKIVAKVLAMPASVKDRAKLLMDN